MKTTSHLARQLVPKNSSSNLSRSTVPTVFADLGEVLRNTFDHEPTDRGFAKGCKELLDRLNQ